MGRKPGMIQLNLADMYEGDCTSCKQTVDVPKDFVHGQLRSRFPGMVYWLHLFTFFGSCPTCKSHLLVREKGKPREHLLIPRNAQTEYIFKAYENGDPL